MNTKYFLLGILLIFILSINICVASELNSTDLIDLSNQQTDDLVKINESLLSGFSDNEISKEGPNENTGSFDVNSKVMYVGQNISDDGGNGSSENPFASLKLVCDNVKDGDDVIINLLSGTHYIGSELIFKSNNTIFNGIGNNVLLKNELNTSDVQSFYFSANYANFTFNNIIFDQSGIGQKTARQFYLVYDKNMDKTMNINLGIFNNCLFMGSEFARITGSSEFNSMFINCTFNNYGGAANLYLFNKNFYNGATPKGKEYRFTYFENVVFLNPKLTRIAQQISTIKNVTMNGVWFGENIIPDYVKGLAARTPENKVADPMDIPISRYAIFSVQENYLGNNLYEIIGKLCWNGTNDTVGDAFSPMTVTLSSATGDIQTNATLENGVFRAVYTSNSSDNLVTAKLDYETLNLNFTNVDLKVDAPSIFYGQDQNITITLPQATNSTLNVTVNNKTYEVKVNDSTSVTFTVPEVLKEGTYVVGVLLNDGEKHIFGSNSTELVVSKVSDYAFAPIVPSDAKVGDTVTIIVELPGDATGDVSVIVGENTFNKTASANVEIEITGLVAGDNNIKIVYSGDDKYVNKSSESIITAEKVEVELNNNTLNVEVPQNTVNPNFSIALPSDATGNLTVIINNKTYTQELVNGNATINVDDLTPGDYNATVTYSGDGKYDAITTTASLTVPKVEVPIKNDTLVTETPKGTTTPSFTIALPSDATGNLTVTIKGKNYNKKLVNGSATVTINDLNPGKYDAIITYSGDSKYDPITSNATVSIPKPVLTSKNFAMLYTSGTKYTVRVTVDGKAVSGKTVTFTINGKKTTAKTDKNGYASVKITLPPKAKAYTVTATYLGVKVTNKVTVKSIVVAKNLKAKKSAKTLKIKVTLKKVNKKYLKGKTVSLKFKGKTYKAKTNKKGVATFTIKKNVLSKLKVGKKYTYKVTYGKDVVSKKVTIKK